MTNDLFGAPLAPEDDDLFEDDTQQEDEENEPSSAPAAPRTPSNAGDCVGLEKQEQQLVTMIEQGKLPHALIFSGPKGVGKATMAYRLVRTLLSRTEEEPGGSLFGAPLPRAPLTSLALAPEDPVFRKVAAGSHPDLLVLGPPEDTTESGKGKSGAILVDVVRKVPQFLSMRASREGGWRAVIVDDANLMNRNAQNALLKILEEPPPHTVLILIAHNLGTFLPTIRSRCRVIPFAPLAPADFTHCLKQIGGKIAPSDLLLLQALTGGCPGQVEDVLAADGLKIARAFLDLWVGWPTPDRMALFEFSEKWAAPGAESGFKFLFDFWLWWVDSCLKAKADPAQWDRLERILEGHGATDAMIAAFSLGQWIDIRERLNEHVGRVRGAFLEKKQAILTAASLFSAE